MSYNLPKQCGISRFNLFRVGLPRYGYTSREGERPIPNRHCHILVPPAEMEALLLQHPKIVDAAVIGVYSEKDATELPRFIFLCRAFRISPSGDALTSSPPSAIQGIRRSQGETTTRSRVRGVLRGDTRLGPGSRGQTQIP